jgi:GNAT superfamily N-acetyltransferase
VSKIVIRNLAPNDFSQANLVVRTAFQRNVDFQPMLELHRTIEREGLWAAWADEHIVGTASAVHYGSLAYLGLMTVHPRTQRRGIGTRLLEHALGWLEARGNPIVLLDATEQGAPLYERYGFIDDARASEWVASRAAIESDHGASPGASLEPEVTAAELAGFELRYFGADRQKLHAALLEQFASRTLVARDQRGSLTGFLMARDPLLGPWCAADAAVAGRLLCGALRQPFQHRPIVQVPRSNSAAGELLAGKGFVLRRALRHMRRGGLHPPGEPAGLFGQASFGHG